MEKRFEELVARAGQDHRRTLRNRRTLRIGFDTKDDGANRVANLELLGRDALLAGKEHLRLADSHIGVAMGNRGNRAADDVANAILVLGKSVGALGLANLLHDHLTRSLRRNAPETRRRHLDLNRVTLTDRIAVIETRRLRNRDEAKTRILVRSNERVKHMERKILTVNGNAEIIRHVTVLAGSLLNGLLDRRENDFTAHAALRLNVLDHSQQLVVHCHFLRSFLSKIKQSPADRPRGSP